MAVKEYYSFLLLYKSLKSKYNLDYYLHYFCFIIENLIKFLHGTYLFFHG